MNYGVRMAVPLGPFYCPLPPDWIGSDHGTTLLLSRRAGCGDSPSRSIELYYGHNVADVLLSDGSTGLVRTTAELVRDRCARPLRSVPGLSLQGAPAVACVERRGLGGSITAGFPYELDPEDHTLGAPNYILTVTLRTTAMTADLPVFRRVLAGVSICTPDWTHPVAGRHACPPGAWW